MKNFKITNNFVSEFIKPIAEYSPNHSNVLVKVLRIDENKKEVCTSLQRDGKKGYNLNGVEKYNIIKAVRYDKVNKTSQQTYYIVMNLTPDCLTLDEGHKNYRETIQALEDIKNAEEVEEEVFSVIEDETPDTEEKTLEEIQELTNEVKEIEPVTIEDSELLDNYFTYWEYWHFEKALTSMLYGRDLSKNPLDFNKGEDNSILSGKLFKLISGHPDGNYGFSEKPDFEELYTLLKTLMLKIRGLDNEKVQEFAKAIQEQEAFKTNERIAIKIHRLRHPNLTDEIETEQALEYIEKAV